MKKKKIKKLLWDPLNVPYNEELKSLDDLVYQNEIDNGDIYIK